MANILPTSSGIIMSKEIKSEELVEKLINNESVSRWDLFKYRKQIRLILEERDVEQNIIDEFNFMIQSAKESL